MPKTVASWQIISVSIILTHNVACSLQKLFEKLFCQYGSENGRSFIYLKSFHRVRVTFNKEENAKEAKKYLHGHLFLGYELGVFLAQVLSI